MNPQARVKIYKYDGDYFGVNYLVEIFVRKENVGMTRATYDYTNTYLGARFLAWKELRKLNRRKKAQKLVYQREINDTEKEATA